MERPSDAVKGSISCTSTHHLFTMNGTIWYQTHNQAAGYTKNSHLWVPGGAFTGGWAES